MTLFNNGYDAKENSTGCGVLGKHTQIVVHKQFLHQKHMTKPLEGNCLEGNKTISDTTTEFSSLSCLITLEQRNTYTQNNVKLPVLVCIHKNILGYVKLYRMCIRILD